MFRFKNKMIKNISSNRNVSLKIINLSTIRTFLTSSRLEQISTRNVATPVLLNTNSNKNLISNNQCKINKLDTSYSSFSTSNVLNLNKEWTTILTNAEKVVGYPTSFLNLRYLVSDEVANFANLIRKLMQTKHPLIKMLRRLIINGNSNNNEPKRSIQINGLIILLISKAAGIPKKQANFLDSEITDGIHISQRRLAEIAEMIYMGSMIHKGVLDLKAIKSFEIKEMDQGNKLAVLCGDYLLASACVNLSKLKNTEVVDLMSQVIGDISQGIFNKGNQQFALLKLWYENVNNNSSSLLANSAKSAMLLVRHSPKLQEIASNFAKNLDIAHKIWSELVDYRKKQVLNKPESLINAIYEDKYKDMSESAGLVKVKAVNIQNTSNSFTNMASSYLSSLYSTSSSETNELVNNYVLNDCKLLFEDHYNLAMQDLKLLENENSEQEAIASLKSILNLMKSSIS